MCRGKKASWEGVCDGQGQTGGKAPSKYRYWRIFIINEYGGIKKMCTVEILYMKFDHDRKKTNIDVE